MGNCSKEKGKEELKDPGRQARNANADQEVNDAVGRLDVLDRAMEAASRDQWKVRRLQQRFEFILDGAMSLKVR
jgi:hypothetical protein